METKVSISLARSLIQYAAARGVAMPELCEVAGNIARALGLGERSLQRELAAEQNSFRQLLDAARRELALSHLRNEKVSVAEVAFLLSSPNRARFTARSNAGRDKRHTPSEKKQRMGALHSG